MYASTNKGSICLGFSIPCVTAFFVISLNTTRSISLSFKSFFSSKYSFTCHAIASPSRSGSVARIIFEESFEEAMTKIDGLYVEVHDFQERGMMAENFNKISDKLKSFGKTVDKLEFDSMLVY